MRSGLFLLVRSVVHEVVEGVPVVGVADEEVPFREERRKSLYSIVLGAAKNVVQKEKKPQIIGPCGGIHENP